MPSIDLVSPPFAGHLHPLLAIGQALQAEATLTVLSTPQAAQVCRLMGLFFTPLLSDRQTDIAAIADPPYQVKNKPWLLMRQFRGNLALMADLRKELRQRWQTQPPDLVIVDSVLPVAGLLAQELGIPWWTTIATPCALESRRGTPSYLGGLKPRQGQIWRWRDAAGRGLIRSFKRFLAWRFAKQFAALDIQRLYRENGEEVIYSPEKILALGLETFELERAWPAALEFIGPITTSPPYEHTPPAFAKGKRHILVSLGTHLPWAKADALALLGQLAQVMPAVYFHFSWGMTQAQPEVQQSRENLILYNYLPYDRYAEHFDAAIIHGGTGITYSCLRAALPMLVWPHDYDQFDHAVRIVHHQLGLRLKPEVSLLKGQLEHVMVNQTIKQHLRDFQQQVLSHQPLLRIKELVRSQLFLS